MDQNVCSLLSVEDDEFFQDELKIQLETQFTVKTARTLEEAKNELQEQSFDVVLINKKLPDGSSIPLISGIHQMNPETCIIVMTADRDFSSLDQALEQGASDFLIKPPHLIPQKGNRQHEFIYYLLYRIRQARLSISLTHENLKLKNQLQNQTLEPFAEVPFEGDQQGFEELLIIPELESSPEPKPTPPQDTHLPTHWEELCPQSFTDHLHLTEKNYLERALSLCHYDLRIVQTRLGFSRTTLYQRLRELQIPTKPVKQSLEIQQSFSPGLALNQTAKPAKPSKFRKS